MAVLLVVVPILTKHERLFELEACHGESACLQPVNSACRQWQVIGQAQYHPAGMELSVDREHADHFIVLRRE